MTPAGTAGRPETVAEAQDKFTVESGELAVKQAQERLEQVEKNWRKNKMRHWIILFRSVCRRTRGFKTHYRITSFRCAADRRHGAAFR